MNNGRNDSDYEILGFCVKLKSNICKSGRISPEKAISLVKREINKVLDKSPTLDRGQVAMMVALKFAYDNLKISDELCRNMDEVQTVAGDVLKQIEEIVPPN